MTEDRPGVGPLETVETDGVSIETGIGETVKTVVRTDIVGSDVKGSVPSDSPPEITPDEDGLATVLPVPGTLNGESGTTPTDILVMAGTKLGAIGLDAGESYDGVGTGASSAGAEAEGPDADGCGLSVGVDMALGGAVADGETDAIGALG